MDASKPGATIVDVGINRVSASELGEGRTKLVRDVDYEPAVDVARAAARPGRRRSNDDRDVSGQHPLLGGTYRRRFAPTLPGVASPRTRRPDQEAVVGSGPAAARGRMRP